MTYVVVGTGPAGVVAAETLCQIDPANQVMLVGDEPEPPYSRMAIPYLLIKNIDEQGTYLRKDPEHFGNSIKHLYGIAQSVDAESKILHLADGQRMNYKALLVATGSKPILPPVPGIDGERVTTCWTLEDARKITATLSPGASVLLIGAGFIGCIILEALVSSGANLTVVEMGDRMVPRMLNQTSGELLKQWCEEKGVNVMTSAQVESIEHHPDKSIVNISDNRQVEAELVISAAGVRSNADFLDGTGVELKNGAVAVDRHMCSSIPGIYAAGDAACGLDFSTGDYSVQAVQPTAVEHGRIAAANMVKHGSVLHQGCINMNVLDTIGLISVSYGNWQGVAGGDHTSLLDRDRFRYINLQFSEDTLIGANTLGMTQHVGILRGLIQGQFKLGKWKQRLMDNPLLIMEAYLAATQGA
ncbi:MAG: NAD(P)/FAD-dependent oxidoreductase [Gammaproteobacteria bacterium]|nr:NAD(P)/FAD-dependent oxidoreductase [Gammaproteobacteria bacterium]MCY4276066.1 NAD(P)/FAD-dependent oxidoreductase [Gammaproteobacteria bacterium]